MTLGIRLACCAVATSAAAVFAIATNAAQAQNYNWSGVYFGGNVGQAWSDLKARDAQSPPGFFTRAGPGGGQVFDLSDDGLIGGVQGGLQHQWSNLVVGGELSLSGAKLSKQITSPYFPATDTESARIRNIFAATARVGFAFDNVLIYGKAGYASADVSFAANSALGNVSYGQSGRQGGLTYGGGIEVGLTNLVTLGVEYNRYDFGSGTLSGVRSNGGREIYKVDTDIQTVTARINFLFGRDETRAAPAQEARPLK